MMARNPAWFAPAIREQLRTLAIMAGVAVACFAIGAVLGYRIGWRRAFVDAPTKVLMLIPDRPPVQFTEPKCEGDCL